MSLYLAVEIPEDIKRKLAVPQTTLKQNCLDGEWEDPTKFHITVRFLTEDNDYETQKKAIEALKLFEVTYQPKKFEIIAKNFYKFEQGVMWIGVHNSFPLYEIKYQIEDCFKKVGRELPKDQFEGYTPHITMGYNVKEKPNFNQEFEGIPIVIDNVSLWPSIKANDSYIHNKLFGVNFK